MKNGIFLILGFLLWTCDGKQHGMISSPTTTAESVYLTRDHEDNAALVWTERSGNNLSLFYAVYSDEGTSFFKKIHFPLASDVATHAEGMPKVAFKSDGTVIAAFEKKAPTKDNKYAGAIFYRMSNDDGASWTDEKILHSDTVAGRSRSYFDIERLPNGEIGASWLDIKLDEDTQGRSVRFARTNKSEGFQSEILVDSSACQCCRIDVYTDKSDNVFVAYRGLKKGKMGQQLRDMMIATSIDQGKSFSAPVLISADNWNIDGCPHTGPSLCSSKAGLISLWYTEGSGTGIFTATKTSERTEFTPREAVSHSGRHPQLTASGDQIAMVWEEEVMDGASSRTVINYRIVKDGLETKRTRLTPKAQNSFLPVVTAIESGFLIAYLMERDNHVGVYFTLVGNSN
jgi:hypothetical protein